MNRRTLLTQVLPGAALLCAPAWAASAKPVRPSAVPALRSFDAAPGEFILRPGARVIPASGTDAIAARSVADLIRRGHAVQLSGAPARLGDIRLAIDTDGPPQPESYRIGVGSTVDVVSRDRAGVGHAVEVLLQWFSQSNRIQRGVVMDWPDYRERGLMLDVGRKYLSVAWIKQRIREMAFFRMNMLHLHLSDRFGFRLASTRHPEITAAQHYTRADIDEIVSYAADYGIEVMPEIGFPGHMNAILAHHPDLLLRPATTSPLDAVTDGVLAGSADGRIDLSKPGARALIADLLHEFVPMFPGSYFHVGGDEYVTDYERYPQLAVAARAGLGPGYGPPDLVADTVNWAAAILRTHGKTARMWNDGIPSGAKIQVDSAVVVDYWTGGDALLPWAGAATSPAQLADDGHLLANAAFTPTYWASGGYAAPLNLPPQALYAWDPGLFVDGTRLRPDQRSDLLGSKLHVWCDDPDAMTEQQMVEPIRARLPIMAQQLWCGTRDLAYSEFADLVRTVPIPVA